MDKLLTTLTSDYENKINILEETMQFSQNLKRETLISKISTFEISRLKTEPKNETAFKTSIHGKKSSHIPSHNENEENDEELEEIIAMITKKKRKENESMKEISHSSFFHVIRLVTLHLSVPQESRSSNLITNPNIRSNVIMLKKV